MSRNEKLKLLCNVSKSYKPEMVTSDGKFMERRETSHLSAFELDQLNIAVHQRHGDVLQCCEMVELYSVYKINDPRRLNMLESLRTNYFTF